MSLSIRYKKITVWKKRLISIERKDSPFIDLLFFQKLSSTAHTVLEAADRTQAVTMRALSAHP